jgi:hypothetical protein
MRQEAAALQDFNPAYEGTGGHVSYRFFGRYAPKSIS